MIQRIQSVYLLLAALLALAVPLTPGVVTPDAWTWYAPVEIALSAIAGVAIVAAIFLYGDRKRQRSVVLACAVLCFGLLAYRVMVSVLAGNPPLQWTHLLPFAALVLLVLARRAISADIELVRSMDRLR